MKNRSAAAAAWMATAGTRWEARSWLISGIPGIHIEGEWMELGALWGGMQGCRGGRSIAVDFSPTSGEASGSCF
ncbi:MAG: hypothetical protein ACOYMT_06790 [Chthoniobacterales bacterium]